MFLDASRRPGLAKARAPRVVRTRHVELAQTHAVLLSGLLAHADVVSEGASRSEPDGRLVYYGTTSLVLLGRTAGGTIEDDEIEQLLRVLPHDPHVRLNALRIARREALTRSSGGLGPLVAEILVERCARGVHVRVELSAKVERPLGAARG